MGIAINDTVSNIIYSVSGGRSPRLPFVFNASTISLTMAFSGRSKINNAVLELPSFTNNPTVTLTILNDAGVELYNSTAKADGQNWNLTVDKVVAENNGTLKLTLSTGAGGSGGTAYLTLYADIIGEL